MALAASELWAGPAHALPTRLELLCPVGGPVGQPVAVDVSLCTEVARAARRYYHGQIAIVKTQLGPDKEAQQKLSLSMSRSKPGEFALHLWLSPSLDPLSVRRRLLLTQLPQRYDLAEAVAIELSDMLLSLEETQTKRARALDRTVEESLRTAAMAQPAPQSQALASLVIKPDGQTAGQKAPAETQTESRTALRKESRKPEAEARPEAGKPEAKATRLEAKPEAKPETKTEAKPDTKPEAKPDTKPEAKPDTKPEVKPDAKPEVKPDTKPEATPEAAPESKPEAKPAPPARFQVPGPAWGLLGIGAAGIAAGAGAGISALVLSNQVENPLLPDRRFDTEKHRAGEALNGATIGLYVSGGALVLAASTWALLYHIKKNRPQPSKTPKSPNPQPTPPPVAAPKAPPPSNKSPASHDLTAPLTRATVPNIGPKTLIKW